MQVAKETATTPVQYAALVAIRQGEGLEIKRLGAMISLDAATLGSVIDRLEAKGLVRRKIGTADRRTKRILITRAGKRLAEEIDALTGAVADQIFVNLSKGERAEFLKLLNKLIGDSELGAAEPPPERTRARKRGAPR